MRVYADDAAVMLERSFLRWVGAGWLRNLSRFQHERGPEILASKSSLQMSASKSSKICCQMYLAVSIYLVVATEKSRVKLLGTRYFLIF